MKTCSKCNLNLPEEQFSKAGHAKDGLQLQCKNCDKVRRTAHKEKIASYEKDFRSAHKKELTVYNKNYYKQRRQIDLQFRIAGNLRAGLRRRLKFKSTTKSSSAVETLGCTIEELRKHLESKFHPNPKTGEVMSWDNYGFYGWHIDHIKPLVSFKLTDPKELKDACHYTNLQPLWAEDNLKKHDKWETNPKNDV